MGNKELEVGLKLKLRLSAVRWPGLAMHLVMLAVHSPRRMSWFTEQY